MALTKLGNYIELCEARNTALKYRIDAVRGISIQKKFIDTKADVTQVSLSPYFVVSPNDFAYVTVTSRNGEKITIAHNDTNDTYLVSSSYVVFKVKRPDLLHSDYLFMWFNRPEFDRYARFNSWGSARETFSFEDMCDVPIDLPSFSVQQKYVNIYNAMLANQRSYERGLEDLKLVCDGYVENLKYRLPTQKIGAYITQSDARNDGNFDVSQVRGLSIAKEIIPTKADMTGVSLHSYKLLPPHNLVYVPVTSRNGGKITIAMNRGDDTYIVSSSYIVFHTDENHLLPAYLMLFFSRDEFDRYARFNSWGSARETFTFDDMCDVKIPMPDTNIQKSIAEIFTSYKNRKTINDKLKAQIKSVCPILIKGSLEERSV